MSERRSYPLVIKINGRQIEEVVIDPHYEEKHPDIKDSLILDLVGKLNGREFQPEERVGNGSFSCWIAWSMKEGRTGWCGACGTITCS
jgi:hypothetical protein